MSKLLLAGAATDVAVTGALAVAPGLGVSVRLAEWLDKSYLSLRSPGNTVSGVAPGRFAADASPSLRLEMKQSKSNSRRARTLSFYTGVSLINWLIEAKARIPANQVKPRKNTRVLLESAEMGPASFMAPA